MLTSHHLQCRSCGGADLAEVLDLGAQPLANRLLRPGSPDLDVEPSYPLGLVFCATCGLLQLSHTVPPEDLFTEYVYFSSFSDGMLRHAEASARQHISEFGLNIKSFVVEVASNDGYLLQHFHSRGIPLLGIEPARNIAAVAESRGITTLAEFFGPSVASSLSAKGRLADLILANNVFAHVPDTNAFVSALATLLRPGGVAVLEFPWALEMIRHLEFDTIYHEHVFYFTVGAIVPLLARHGLELFRVERLPIHGGSLRIYCCHSRYREREASVIDVMQEENEAGTRTLGFYETFANNVVRLREDLRGVLAALKSDGNTIAAYGASAKGSTLLNYCNIGKETIEFVVDRSHHKQGMLTPGKHLPILSPVALEQKHPNYTLLLAWNFAEEIILQQDAYRRSGGRFIVPVPSPWVAE